MKQVGAISKVKSAFGAVGAEWRLQLELQATAAVAAYAVAVKLWLTLAGERLAPVHFTTEATPPAE